MGEFDQIRHLNLRSEVRNFEIRMNLNELVRAYCKSNKIHIPTFLASYQTYSGKNFHLISNFTPFLPVIKPLVEIIYK